MNRMTRTKSPTNNAKMIVYKSPNNVPFPREYICKLRTRFSGTLASAGFTGGAATFILIGNDVFLPFSLLPAANITWCNAATPLSAASTGHGKLGQVGLYESALTLATKVRFWMNPSGTVQNDGLMATITPTNTGGGANPTNCTNALNQPYVKWAEFRGAGNAPKPITSYVDWARFLGISKHTYANDADVTWGQIYNSSPTNKLYMVINITTLDAAAPSATVPFTIELTQYVKYFKFDAAQFA